MSGERSGPFTKAAPSRTRPVGVGVCGHRPLLLSVRERSVRERSGRLIRGELAAKRTVRVGPRVSTGVPKPGAESAGRRTARLPVRTGVLGLAQAGWSEAEVEHLCGAPV